jgi:hypothetical protein
VSRLTLPNGDWADFDERLNYAQARRIREAVDTLDAEGIFVCALVKAWALRDVDDQPIEFPAREANGIPLEALQRVPFDTFQAMTIHAAEQLEGVPDPKGTSGTSTGSAPAKPSASRRTSPRPSSSRTIQDGATPTFKPPLPM